MPRIIDSNRKRLGVAAKLFSTYQEEETAAAALLDEPTCYTPPCIAFAGKNTYLEEAERQRLERLAKGEKYQPPSLVHGANNSSLTLSLSSSTTRKRTSFDANHDLNFLSKGATCEKKAKLSKEEKKDSIIGSHEKRKRRRKRTTIHEEDADKVGPAKAPPNKEETTVSPATDPVAATKEATGEEDTTSPPLRAKQLLFDDPVSLDSHDRDPQRAALEKMQQQQQQFVEEHQKELAKRQEEHHQDIIRLKKEYEDRIQLQLGSLVANNKSDEPQKQPLSAETVLTLTRETITTLTLRNEELETKLWQSELEGKKSCQKASEKFQQKEAELNNTREEWAQILERIKTRGAQQSETEAVRLKKCQQKLSQCRQERDSTKEENQTLLQKLRLALDELEKARRPSPRERRRKLGKDSLVEVFEEPPESATKARYTPRRSSRGNPRESDRCVSHVAAVAAAADTVSSGSGFDSVQRSLQKKHPIPSRKKYKRKPDPPACNESPPSVLTFGSMDSPDKSDI